MSASCFQPSTDLGDGAVDALSALGGQILHHEAREVRMRGRGFLQRPAPPLAGRRLTVMDELHDAWQEQVATEAERRHERILWIWTLIGAGIFLVAFVWWMALSLTQG